MLRAARMKTILLAALCAFAFGAIGCAAPAEEEEAEQTPEALSIRAGGGDPDECLRALYGCYSSCRQSGSASCYRYCDHLYAQCRGLPDPRIGLTRQ